LGREHRRGQSMNVSGDERPSVTSALEQWSSCEKKDGAVPWRCDPVPRTFVDDQGQGSDAKGRSPPLPSSNPPPSCGWCSRTCRLALQKRDAAVRGARPRCSLRARCGKTNTRWAPGRRTRRAGHLVALLGRRGCPCRGAKLVGEQPDPLPRPVLKPSDGGVERSNWCASNHLEKPACCATLPSVSEDESLLGPSPYRRTVCRTSLINGRLRGGRRRYEQRGLFFPPGFSP